MEVAILLALIILNGFFSMSEIALISSKKARLVDKATKGDKNAILALKLLDNPDSFLSSVQVGITLIGVVSGAYGSQVFTSPLEAHFLQIPMVAAYAHPLAFGIVITTITYLSIVMGELLPKKIGLIYSDQIASFMAPALNLFSRITYPIVWFFSKSTYLLSKLFFLKENESDKISEDELKMMVKMANEGGAIDNKESELIHNILRFADRKAYSVMTPRNEVAWLDINESNEEIHDDIIESGMTKFPVCDDSLDNFMGVLNLKDYLMNRNKPGFNITQIMSPAVSIPENLTALKILENFRKERRYFGMVINEFGSVEGIITLHDLTENIFGYLPDLEEEEEIMVFKREDGTFLVDGSCQIDELREFIIIDEFFDEDLDYTTIAGFIMDKLGKIPVIGDHLVDNGYRFEIIDLDKSKVDKVLVEKIKEENTTD